MINRASLRALVFLPCPVQGCLCLTSTWLGDFGAGGGVRRWGGQQEVLFLFFSLVFPLRSLTFTLARAGTNIADGRSAAPTSLAAHRLSPRAPLPAVLRQAETRGRGASYILPFPRGRLGLEASEEGKVKKRIYNPRKTLSSL